MDLDNHNDKYVIRSCIICYVILNRSWYYYCLFVLLKHDLLPIVSLLYEICRKLQYVLIFFQVLSATISSHLAAFPPAERVIFGLSNITDQSTKQLRYNKYQRLWLVVLDALEHEVTTFSLFLTAYDTEKLTNMCSLRTSHAVLIFHLLLDKFILVFRNFYFAIL